MCGRFNLIQSPYVIDLMIRLGISNPTLRFNDDCAPCLPISIIRNSEGQTSIEDAIWHLYLQAAETGFKPHPDYWSINTNWRQLGRKLEFKRTRCLIPASAFVESQDGKNPYLLDFEGDAFCFGGLYKQWRHPKTGETTSSASIITLAGHPKLEHIHRKSLPLIFNSGQMEEMARWLDEDQQDIAVFDNLLKPTLRKPLRAQRIDKSSTKNVMEQSHIIAAD